MTTGDSSLSVVIVDGSWHRCQQRQPLAAGDDHAAGVLALIEQRRRRATLVA